MRTLGRTKAAQALYAVAIYDAYENSAQHSNYFVPILNWFTIALLKISNFATLTLL